MTRRAWALTALAFALTWGLPAASTGASSGIQVAPIKAVILVDESGSLDQPAVANERNAAAVLALSELSPASQFAIDGFGSSNGPGQNAVTAYCDFITVTDHVARERLAACARRVHRRQPAEGDDTDHAAALSQAVNQLAQTPSGMTPVIFLMTDGVLDVARSPQYGRIAAQRTAAAMREIQQQILPQARRAGIQVWALGFGPQVSKPALDTFAAGGAGSNSHCAGATGTHPTGVVVGSSTEVITGLLRTLGRARCAQVEDPDSGRLEPGKTLTLTVRIPVIATDGAITVTKVDPSFRVAYYDPKGHQAPALGTLSGQTFELSGGNDTVEALRIQDPIPGNWKVKVTDPAGHPGQLVTATAVWQGALQGAVSLTPGAPAPEKPAVVRVSLLTRSGLIRDAGALRGVRTSASVTGNFGTLAIPLRDDGNTPDDHAHDGVFSGTLMLPKGAEGNATVVGRITGEGLASDERPYYFTVGGGVPTVVVEFDPPVTVHPGATLSGKIDVNNAGQAQSGKLQLMDTSEGALVTISPTSFAMPAGHSVTPFSVHLASSTPKRQTTFTVRATDAQGTKNDVIGSVNVTTPPSLFSRFWWILPILVLLAAMAVVLGRRRRISATKQIAVRDLVAELQRRGQEVSRLHAPRDGSVFPIDVIDDDEAPRIRLGANGRDSTLEVKRSLLGFTLEGPNQPRVEGQFGKEIQLNERLGIVIRDSRSKSGATAAQRQGPAEPLISTTESDEPDDL